MAVNVRESRIDGKLVVETGDFTSVRFSFGFLRDDECYGDFSPTPALLSIWSFLAM